MITSTSAITATHLKKVKIITGTSINSTVRLSTQWLCIFAFYSIPTRCAVTYLFIWTPNSFCMVSEHVAVRARIPTVKLKIPSKLFFLKSNPELLLHSSYSFQKRLLYFSHFFMVADLLSPIRYHWQIAKVKNYNLNVTEVLDPTLKKVFPEFSISPSGS